MPQDPKLSRDELVKLVEKIMQCEGTEEDQDAHLALLESQLIDPKVSDYIFYSSPEMTAEEVVDKALAYRPISLDNS